MCRAIVLGHDKGKRMRTRTLMSEAKKLGRAAGLSAASWVFDGNTSAETYQRFAKGISDGDPMILDSVREPNLSGEYADDPTPQTIASDLGIESDDDRLDDVCTAWEDAARKAFWGELERVCAANI